jgi:hypothetical protein
MLVNITRENAIEALESVVATAGGDFVYAKADIMDDGPLCVYVRNGRADCGVGRALHHLGVPLSVLGDLDGTGDSTIGNWRNLDYLADRGFMIEDEAVKALATFQQHQDNGSRWADCLIQAYQS